MIPNLDRNFSELSLDSARDFLQSVVVIDDQATMDNQATMEPSSGQAGELEAPDGMASAAETEDDIKVLAKRTHSLDARMLIQAFASQGLVCGILKPDSTHGLSAEALKLAPRSDILVIDWELNDKGERATDLIKAIMESDAHAGGRLRLIAIYTGTAPLRDVSTKLGEAIPALMPTGSGKPWLRDLSRSHQHCKVIFLGKGSFQEEAERQLYVSPELLPGRLVDEFAKFAGGLLPNATLATIAQVRKHTHKILARFDRSMDGPLLTHRTLCPTSSDAEAYLVDLIIQEIEAHVPFRKITRQYAGADSVRLYLSKKSSPAKIMADGEGKDCVDMNIDEAVNFIEGDENNQFSFVDSIKTADTDTKVDIKKNIHKRLYLLTDDNIKASRANHEKFAIVSSLRRSMSDVGADCDDEDLPQLKIGSIVKIRDKHFMCLTPLCDSVRIDENGATFLFCHLKKNGGEFNIIVPDGSGLTKLKLDRKHMHFESLVFKPKKGTDFITPYHGSTAEKGRALIFNAEGDVPGCAVPVFWLAELKSMHAQRVSQLVSSYLSRIGLDEFEWQRRFAPISTQ